MMMFGKAGAIACMLACYEMLVQTQASPLVGDEECRSTNDGLIKSTPFLAHRSVIHTPKHVLVATPLKNAAAALPRFSEALRSLTYPKAYLSVAFLVSDSVDNTVQIARELRRDALHDFENVQVFEQDFHYIAPEDRHAYAVQAARRAVLAKSRNTLIEKALTEDTFAVLWLDADVTGFPKTLVEDMLSIGRPVVAPHVLIGELTYDRNTWRENKPEEAFQVGGPEVVFEGYPETALAGGARSYMDDLRASALAKGVSGNERYAVCIDGVGTAVLFVEARVHREGVLFPDVPYKKRLESEGFGLWAKDRGFQPCGLPFYEVYHFDEWTNVDTHRKLAANKVNKTREGDVCPSWCSQHHSVWATKCEWKNCMGCPVCSRGGNATSRSSIVWECTGSAECKGKEMKACQQLKREGKCEWGQRQKSSEDGPGDCTGPAECSGKDFESCRQMQRQEGKCKWEFIKPGDVVPGECVGKAECDDKPKNTCRQLGREGKCAWVPAPTQRKTPTGDCLGQAECLGKTRRICHRMRQQEGKCHWKPAPENEVKVQVTIKNVDFNKMDSESKEELHDALQSTIADKAGVDETAVNITLAAGSVKVAAAIDLEEKIGIMEGESEGQGVDLLAEMNSLKAQVQNELETGDAQQEILTVASSVDGVQQAATGEIAVTDPEASATVEVTSLATKPPSISGSTTPEDASSSTDSPALGEEPHAASGSEEESQRPVSLAAMHFNAFGSMLVAGAIAAVVN